MKIRSTTVVCVRRDGRVVIGGDGQVTLDKTVMKDSAQKVRRLGDGRVLAGFAGSTADAFTLFERFEAKLQEHQATWRAPRGAGEGLAHRPLPAPARGPARSSPTWSGPSSSPAPATSSSPTTASPPSAPAAPTRSPPRGPCWPALAAGRAADRRGSRCGSPPTSASTPTTNHASRSSDDCGTDA